MDESNNNEQRPRASLRGKGREILLGRRPGAETPPETGKAKKPSPPWAGRVDASALSLTPEETEALLDFSPSAPSFDAEPPSSAEETAPARQTPESPFPSPDDALLDWMTEETSAESKKGPAAPASGYDDVPDWVERVDQGLVPSVPGGSVDRTADTELFYPTQAPAASYMADALPLAERGRKSVEAQHELAYQVRPEVEALIPREPERWPEPHPGGISAEAIPAGSEEDQGVEAEDSEGGVAELEAVAAEEPATPVLPEPFQPVPKREASRALFGRTSPANKRLLDLLVDDDRIRKLAEQIEALQEELAQQVYADQDAADVYQQEILQANSLLMASRQNYDDARAVVYRIRTDMNRQRKTYADIMRYRPLLLNYYIGWGIALGVLFLLKALFTGVTDAVGVGVVSALYYPMLLGVGGALISGYLTLERHTTRLRDFDPIHISWYLFNPLLGGVMGLLMFLIASIANEDLLQESATRPEYAITYLLCVVAGMNQNNVLRRLNDLLKRFSQDTAK
jgi:hypothetical protein